MYDSDKFEVLYREYYRYAFNVCKRMVGEDLADDMAQDTFLRIFKYEGFRGEAKIKTWIHRVAVNTCLEYFRNQNRRIRSDKYNIPIEVMVNHPATRPTKSIEKITLFKSIDSLAKGYRLYFILHGIEGYEHQEIAKVLHKNIGTSKSQYRRAVKVLKKELQK